MKGEGRRLEVGGRRLWVGGDCFLIGDSFRLFFYTDCSAGRSRSAMTLLVREIMPDCSNRPRAR